MSASPLRHIPAASLFFSCMVTVVAAQPGTDILPQSSLAALYFGNDAPWFEKNIPFFDCSDPQIKQIYYYRWQLYKAHLKDVGARGYIVTEFLDDVGWAWNPYQSLNDATAFHINEGRWLRDQRYVDDYINFMYAGGNDRHFSESIAAATYGDYLVTGDPAVAVKNLDSMIRIYDQWKDHYDASKGLYYIEPIADATEYSIASIDASGGRDGFLHGDSFRPTINSFMYANALAISRLATLAGNTNAATTFAANAGALRDAVQTKLWNDHLQDFTDRFKANNRYVHYWDFIRGRELAGYVPWAFELPDQDPKYNAAWAYLLSTNEFAGPYGLRTVGPGYQYYMRQYRYAFVNGIKMPECEWNGPSWPFDTTLVLDAVANLLNDYNQDILTAGDYMRLLKQYTREHYLNGSPDLQEDYNPDTGKVIVGLPRSNHYNHSDYNDLIITGLIGLRPRADNTVEINPLIPSDPRSADAIGYFCLENVPYHGHLVTILYDRDGTHYQKGAGLSAYVDGQIALAASPLGRKTFDIPAPVIDPAPQPVNLAVNYARKDFPVPFASTNNSPNNLYQAIDGRVWFYPDVKNYWSNAGSQAAADWYGLDFGAPSQISSVRLYFYADDTRFKVPRKFTVQYCAEDGSWKDVADQDKSPAKPLANGENIATFSPVSASKIRVLFTNPKKANVALVEIKAYQ
jgi:hypothetical protein